MRAKLKKKNTLKKSLTALVFCAVCIFPGLISAAELVIWNMPEAADAQYRQLWNEDVKDFEGRTSGVTIKGINRQYKPQEFVSVMASGKGPDIARIPVTAIPVMSKYGFLADISSFTQNWMQKDYMPPIMWGAVESEGRQYGIPYDSYFTTLMYRKSIFEKCGLTAAPQTWQELIDYSKIINEKMPQTRGIALQPDMFYFIDFIWQTGGDVYSNGKINLNTPETARALKFWHDLKWVHGAMPLQNIFYDYDVEQLFSSGKIAMMIGVANRIPVMERRYGLNRNDVEIVPLPAGDTGIKAWHAGGDAFIINAGISEEKKKLAWAYIEYIMSPLYQLSKWSRMNQMEAQTGKKLIFPNDFSCATNLMNMPEFAKVKDLLSFAHVEPTSYKWPMIKEDFNRYVLEKIFIEKDVDFEKTLSDFAQRMKREKYE